MGQCRHWKQRFDVNAKMVFRKSRKLGLAGKERCEPGDEVTEEMKAILGRHRLKMWWEAGMIELLVEESKTSDEESEPGTMTHTGGGWYDVVRADGVDKRVRGRDIAEAFLNG